MSDDYVTSGKKIGKDFGNEYGQEIGKELESEKVLKMKKKFEAEKKERNWLFMALLLSWIFFFFLQFH